MFSAGDRVVVITHDPDEDFREREIPIGTEGIIFDESSGEAENPETSEYENTYWVDFDLQHENHRWTQDRNGLVRACMFESMLELLSEEAFETSPLDDLF